MDMCLLKIIFTACHNYALGGIIILLRFTTQRQINLIMIMTAYRYFVLSVQRAQMMSMNLDNKVYVQTECKRSTLFWVSNVKVYN